MKAKKTGMGRFGALAVAFVTIAALLPQGGCLAAQPSAKTALVEEQAVASLKENSATDLSELSSIATADVQYTVDFTYLQQLNRSIVGWVFQESSDLNAPILQGTDNEYYITHLYDGSKSRTGSVFMDYGNSSGFTDGVTYLYGSSTAGSGAFASLSQYMEQSYYQENPSFLLLTPQANEQVELFAVLKTTTDDTNSWLVPSRKNETEHEVFLEKLLAESALKAPSDSLPLWNDRLLVLVTYSNVARGRRYVLYGRIRTVNDQTENKIDINKLDMDRRTTRNGFVTIDGVGDFMTYAQNDELWDGLRYEAKDSGKRRKFGEGGCGPTAAAMAIANLVEQSDLPKLSSYAGSGTGYTFCTCSANNLYCNRSHVQYQLKTPEEFLRYLPLAVAGFTTGNNQWGILSRGTGQGTNMRFLEKLCEVYGIGITTTRVAAEAIQMLQEGNGKRVVISCATRGSPFTKTGHYVVMAAADDEYVYILDPLRDNDYSSYLTGDYVEVLAPGVVRISVENAAKCNLSPHYILEVNQ
ncbi:MAG: class B sortase [Eubacteriales bacterium]|nr:class B sortase [Eubacteriales bacterium]